MKITHGKRRIASSQRMKATSRPVKAARTETIQYLNFNEMSDEQKDQAVKLFVESDTAYQWHSEDMMEYYRSSVEMFASDLTENTGIQVDTKKLHWGSNSQGPYPEWHLSAVFGEQDFGDYSIDFYGESTDIYADCYDAAGDEMSSIPEDAQAKIDAAQVFMDDVWQLINEVCQSYPTEEWAYDMLEANDYEFRVDAEGNVVSMA